MALDANFSKIEKVERHPNADKLDIATVGGYTVVCGKDEVKEGEIVFYIRDDAKLVEYENLKKYGEPYGFKYPWQQKLLKYLGSGGRVKTVKLRGVYSSGIIVPVKDVYSHINVEKSKDWQKDNEILNGEFAGPFLLGKFGVGHYSIPIRNAGDLSARGNTLVFSLWKTDEENYQSIDEKLFPWGDDVLVTRKLDGSSESISASPNGEIHVMSRSMDLMTNADNNYNRAAKVVIPLIKKYAEYYNVNVVVRGEMTSANTNKNRSNIDAVGEPTFHMFASVFPDEKEYAKKIGMWGTENHFLEFNKRLKKLTGEEILTVPILGIEKLSKELLEKYANAPKEDGEGVVFNLNCEKLPHFKSKSKDYLANLK